MNEETCQMPRMRGTSCKSPKILSLQPNGKLHVHRNSKSSTLYNSQVIIGFMEKTVWLSCLACYYQKHTSK